MDISTIVLLYLVAVNLIAFHLMGKDKKKAKTRGSRIPEKTLFLWAIIGGSIGSIAGMQHFRHKTRHTSFRIGMPLILILQVYFFGRYILGLVI
ncbi:MAG: hypothetical protein PWR29_653 [Methanolobus sp.]|nr:hypothetical protein [Methanolobus sp.]